jgi:hypothetical protein
MTNDSYSKKIRKMSTEEISNNIKKSFETTLDVNGEDNIIITKELFNDLIYNIVLYTQIFISDKLK